MRKLTVLACLLCASLARAQETPQALLERALRLGDKYSLGGRPGLVF